MSLAEKIELTLLPLAGLAVFACGPMLPTTVSGGRLLFLAAAALLFQSLVRDLSLLAAARRRSAGTRRVARCMCIESTVGVGGLAIGGLAAGMGLGGALSIAPWTWGVLAFAMGLVGFWLKDFVIEWRPWKIRRDPDHLNILVEWKW